MTDLLPEECEVFELDACWKCAPVMQALESIMSVNRDGVVRKARAPQSYLHFEVPLVGAFQEPRQP